MYRKQYKGAFGAGNPAISGRLFIWINHVYSIPKTKRTARAPPLLILKMHGVALLVQKNDVNNQKLFKNIEIKKLIKNLAVFSKN